MTKLEQKFSRDFSSVNDTLQLVQLEMNSALYKRGYSRSESVVFWPLVSSLISIDSEMDEDKIWLWWRITWRWKGRSFKRLPVAVTSGLRRKHNIYNIILRKNMEFASTKGSSLHFVVANVRVYFRKSAMPLLVQTRLLRDICPLLVKVLRI